MVGKLANVKVPGTFTALLATVFLAAACGSQPAAVSTPTSTPTPKPPTTVSLTDQSGSIVTALIDVAQAEGFFTKNDLNVQLVQVSNGPAAATALGVGAVDVATNAPTVFLPLAARGIKIEVIAGETTQTQALVGRPGLAGPSAFPKSVVALKGMRIGVTALSSNQQYGVQAVLKSLGLPADYVQFVATGKDAFPALSAGRVDAAILIGSKIAEAEKLGGKVLVDLRNKNSCPQVPICGISSNAMWARTSWVQAHPSAVQGLRRAIAESYAFLHSKGQEKKVAAVLANLFGANALTAGGASSISNIVDITNGAFSRQDMRTWISFSLQNHIINSNLSVNAVYAPGTPESSSMLMKLAK